jgi:DNA mismatch repair protein MutL
MRQRIVSIFSGKTNEKLVPVQEETEIVTIHGFIGKPEFAKTEENSFSLSMIDL